MAEALKDVMPQQFIYHYLPSRLKYIYHKLLNREYRNIRLKDLHMQRLSHEETSKICRSSRCVLDAPASGQRKLITTNEDAVNYDFYRPENILIFRGSIDPDDPFFASPYIELPQDIYEKYSIRNWLATILNG